MIKIYQLVSISLKIQLCCCLYQWFKRFHFISKIFLALSKNKWSSSKNDGLQNLFSIFYCQQYSYYSQSFLFHRKRVSYFSRNYFHQWSPLNQDLQNAFSTQFCNVCYISVLLWFFWSYSSKVPIKTFVWRLSHWNFIKFLALALAKSNFNTDKHTFRISESTVKTVFV